MDRSSIRNVSIWRLLRSSCLTSTVNVVVAVDIVAMVSANMSSVVYTAILLSGRRLVWRRWVTLEDVRRNVWRSVVAEMIGVHRDSSDGMPVHGELGVDALIATPVWNNLIVVL